MNGKDFPKVSWMEGILKLQLFDSGNKCASSWIKKRNQDLLSSKRFFNVGLLGVIWISAERSRASKGFVRVCARVKTPRQWHDQVQKWCGKGFMNSWYLLLLSSRPHKERWRQQDTQQEHHATKVWNLYKNTLQHRRCSWNKRRWFTVYLFVCLVKLHESQISLSDGSAMCVCVRKILPRCARTIHAYKQHVVRVRACVCLCMAFWHAFLKPRPQGPFLWVEIVNANSFSFKLAQPWQWASPVFALC